MNQTETMKKPFLFSNGEQSTLNYKNNDYPIKNHNLVVLDEDETVIPLDHCISKIEYKEFRDSVDKGDPFKQQLSGDSHDATGSWIARYHDGKLNDYLSPIKNLKKEFAGTNREMENNSKQINDYEFLDIYLKAIKQAEPKTKVKDRRSEFMARRALER